MKQVWYVRGADPEAWLPEFFATKMAAEMYARQKFPDDAPDDAPDERYARVFYRTIWEEEDLR